MQIILLHYRCALKINYSDPDFHIQPNESQHPDNEFILSLNQNLSRTAHIKWQENAEQSMKGE